MNLRNISANQIIVWSALILGLVLSVAIGNAVGSSDFRLAAGVVALIPVAVIFVKLKFNIWVLLPIGWYLTGRLPWLPLPFTVRDLCFMTVIFFFTLFFATRALPWKRKLTALDFLIYINLAYLAIVYVRNPAGFWAMQTSVVGGRPYFEIVLAFGAFMVLSRVNISALWANVLPLFFVIPAWSLAVLQGLGQILPQTGAALNRFYTGIGEQSAVEAFRPDAQIGQTRIAAMQFAGSSTIVALCSRFNPVSLISPLYPLRMMMLATAFAAVFLSGYRTVMLFGLAIFFLSSVLRGRSRDLLTAAAVGLIALIVLISLQGSVIKLPYTMQRALSWLPGNWDEEVVADAEWSSRWRFEMWAWAWNDTRVLRDKIWGTGFGLSLDDMSLIAASLTAGQGGQNLLGGSDRESFMITGTFHSGPLSTIRYIGIVGLTFYLVLLLYMAIAAYRLCIRSRSTEAFPLALFVSLPIIYEPFQFIIVFGALEASYPQTLFWAGLLNLASRYHSKIDTKLVLDDYALQNRLRMGSLNTPIATHSRL